MKNLNKLNYCPVCKKYVEITRNPFKDDVIIIWTLLIICTVGLVTPVLFYLYFRRKKNRCKICNNIVVIIPPGQDLTKIGELPKEMYSIPIEEPKKNLTKSEKGTLDVLLEPEKIHETLQAKNAVIFYRKLEFCPFCGEKIIDEGAELCSRCGADLNEGD